MSYERAMYERLICDGCGVAVLETEDVLSHAPDWGWSVGDKHLCHMCQPDSPFEAVERVRELLASGTFEAIRGAQRTRVVSAYHLRKALDGGA